MQLVLYRTDTIAVAVIYGDDADILHEVQDLLLEFPPQDYEPATDTPYSWDDLRQLEVDLETLAVDHCELVEGEYYIYED